MPDGVTQEVVRVLVACRAIELATAGLYTELAALHAQNPTIARLWKKTAREEMNHAAQFTLLFEVMASEVLAACVDVSTLDRLRRAIENAIEECALSPPTIREALVAAIDFEEWMNRFHADTVLLFKEPQGKRLFQAMMAADSGHVGELRAALVRLTRG